MNGLEAKPDWAGLQAVGRVESARIIGDRASTECRYCLCSFSDRDRFAATVRGHWGNENQQHWVLDVQFGEDACRTRNDHSAQNLALIRRVALNMLRHNGPHTTVSAVANSAPPSTMITGCTCSSASPVRLPHSAIALSIAVRHDGVRYAERNPSPQRSRECRPAVLRLYRSSFRPHGSLWFPQRLSRTPFT